jgi:hypothetical protein
MCSIGGWGEGRKGAASFSTYFVQYSVSQERVNYAL